MAEPRDTTAEISAVPLAQMLVVRPTTDTFDIAEEALGNDLPPNYYLSPRFLGTVLACSLGYNSANLGYVLSANSMARINADIGPSENLVWIGLAYTLTLGISFLLVGRLSDIFGRRWFFIIGNACAVLGCIIAGTASSIDTIIGGNVFNGIAGGVQISFPMVIEELVPNKQRPIWVSGIFISGVAMLGFGPVVAQALGEHTAAGWRWCFYLGIIVSGATVVLLLLCYFPPAFHLLHKRRSRWEQAKRMDFVGMVLFVAGLVLFLMGLGWGGQKYPWRSAHVIATIVVGACSLVAFVVYDAYHKGDSLLPMYLFKSRGFGPMIACATVGSCVYYSMVILWPQQISFLFPGSSLHSALLACIVGCATEIGQFSAGFLLRIVPWHQRLLIFICVLLTAVSGAMAAVEPGDQALGCVLMSLACFCVGVIECVAVVVAPITCPPEDLGAALGALGSIRSAFAAVATAIYSSILSNKLSSFMPPAVSEAAIEAGLPRESLPSLLAHYATNITTVPGMNPTIASAVESAVASAAAHAFRFVWYAVIAFGGVAIISSCFTIDYGAYFTDQVSRKLQHPIMGGKDEERRPDEETKQLELAQHINA